MMIKWNYHLQTEESVRLLMLFSLQYCHLQVNTVNTESVFYFILMWCEYEKVLMYFCDLFLTVHAEFGVKLKLLSFLVSLPHPVANNHKPTDI